MRNIFVMSLLACLFLVQCTPKTGNKMSAEAREALTEATKAAEFRKQAPAPGPAPIIQLGSYEKFTLANGLQVIVVENHKIPRVSFSLTVDRDPVKEGEYAGLTDLAGQMLSRGTTTKTKAQIDEEVDFMGARLRTSSTGMFAASLRKHSDNLLKIMSDVLLNPSFPEDEFEKIKKQTISGLASQKDDPSAIAANVAAAIGYGKDHPYGEIVTEETVENITVDKCKDYYHTYFKPNISYLVVVGDITEDEAKTMVENYFGTWEKGKVPEHNYENPKAPEKSKVEFVHKAGAVQSVITVGYPLDLKPGAEDAIKASVLNTIIGGYFASRLNANLREDKAYTYGAGSTLNTDEVIGFFAAQTNVRNEVTDSAVVQILYELNKIRDEKVPADELTMVKNYMSGGFARSLEDPQTVARFALNTIRYNLPEDYYATYLEKLNAVRAEDIQTVARKYIKPDQAHILIVGNKDEVAENLVKIAPGNELIYYDKEGNLIEDNLEVPEGMTAEKVIEDYLNAIGGEDALRKVKSLKTVMSSEMQGQSLNLTLFQKEGKFAFAINMEGIGEVQKMVYNDGKGAGYQMGQKTPIDDDQLAGMEESTHPFIELLYKDKGYKLELTGVEKVEKTNAYVIQIETPEGEQKTHYFAMDTGFKIREVETRQNGPQPITQTTDLGNYQEIEGIQFPQELVQSGALPMPLKMVVQNIEVNGDIDDSVFSVE